MKKKMHLFRNQFLILGFGSLMIVSCSKEDLADIFGGGHHKKCGTDTTVVDNGGNECLTCGKDSVVYDKDSTVYVDPNEDGGAKKDSVVPDDGGGVDSADGGGWKYFDSVYNKPNYDPQKDGLLLGH